MWSLPGASSASGRKRKKEVTKKNSARSFFYKAQAIKIPRKPIIIPKCNNKFV
jgi:hypothetical protein